MPREIEITARALRDLRYEATPSLAGDNCVECVCGEDVERGDFDLHAQVCTSLRSYVRHHGGADAA